jgi:pyruvate formate lyase activating enzyme
LIESINEDFVRKGKYQKYINNKLSQCLTCERKCKIREGEVGHCGTRLNFEGEIYTIVYGCIPSRSVNPIELKPLYHFHPGTKAFTVGTFGCNFDCFWCQNWHLSHPQPSVLHKIKTSHEYLSPEKFIEKALERNCEGISISFNEPTLLFEYSLDVFNLAHQNNLYNTYVSNGYMTKNVLTDLIEHGLDAINIDIKGDSAMVKKYCGTDVEKVWRNARLFIENDIHVEITTLLIEGFNSSVETIKAIVNRVKEELGTSIPLHLTRAFPRYRSKKYGFTEDTSLKMMHRALLIAKSQGLENVYLGNV